MPLVLDEMKKHGTVNPMAWKNDINAAPSRPGCYQFFDEGGNILYVGKAVNLKNRLNDYLHPDQPRIRHMTEQAKRVDWIVTNTETEALETEATLINKHQPAYNIRLREADGYPYIAFLESDKPTRVQIWRHKPHKKVERYGPYVNGGQAQALYDVILSSWGPRSCKDGKYQQHKQMGRMCILGEIGKCSAPCTNRVDSGEHEKLIKGAKAFLNGNTKPTEKRLKEKMQAAADSQKFEQAAQTRDQLKAVVQLSETRTAAVSDMDVVGWADDGLGACLQFLCVRNKTIVSYPTVVVDQGLDQQQVNLVQAIVGFYQQQDIPRLVVLAKTTGQDEILQEVLSSVRGSSVHVQTAKRKRRKTLGELAEVNAKEALKRARMRRSGDLDTRRGELVSLQEVLNLEKPPLRIECFDISHHQGAGTVGGMSVLEDGLPARGRYRTFTLENWGGDDYQAMFETIKRRLERLKKEDYKFGAKPDLILIDGGKGQLAMAVKAREHVGVSVTFASLAKRLEEIWLEGARAPILLEYDDPALFLLQRARDEAHTTSLKAGRKLREKALTAHPLEGIKGLGPVRRERLMKQAGSLNKLKNWNRARYRQETWLSEKVADNVYRFLHEP